MLETLKVNLESCSTGLLFQPFFPPCDLVWAPYLLPQPMQPSSRQLEINKSWSFYRLDLKWSLPPCPGSRSMSSTQRTAHEAGATVVTLEPEEETSNQPATQSSHHLSLPYTHIQVHFSHPPIRLYLILSAARYCSVIIFTLSGSGYPVGHHTSAFDFFLQAFIPCFILGQTNKSTCFPNENHVIW